MPVLYSILLHNDCSANGLGPTDLSPATLKVTKAVFCMLTSIAKMDPETFQVKIITNNILNMIYHHHFNSIIFNIYNI